MNTIEAATGRWREILPALGVAPVFLNGKHQPCPLCGGKDRARFTDLNEQGNYFCNQCGAGTGITLLMKLHGWDFAKAAKEVDVVIGNLPREKPKSVAKRKATYGEMNAIWNSGVQITIGDPVGKYLAGRGLSVRPELQTALRYVKKYQWMVAKFCDSIGSPMQIHRTMLKSDGSRERKFLPGELPKGGAIRLGVPENYLGVAEGIETALSASALFDMPVWSTTSAVMLREWEAPLTVPYIVIFGDNDANYTGQAAAFALANRLVLDAERREIKRTVEVRIPGITGQDWNDVLLSSRAG